MESGKIKVRPKWLQVELDDAEEELEWADKKPNRVLVLCSCPSQIGEDKAIMDKVKAMCQGKPNVEITFSEAGNATSDIP